MSYIDWLLAYGIIASASPVAGYVQSDYDGLYYATQDAADRAEEAANRAEEAAERAENQD